MSGIGRTAKCMVYNCDNDAEWRLYTRKGHKTNTRYCYKHYSGFAKEEGIWNMRNARYWQLIMKPKGDKGGR